MLQVGMARLLVDEFAVLIRTEVWSAGEYDDADPVAYENRVQAYRDSNSRLAVSDESEDVVFEGGFRVPADIYNPAVRLPEDRHGHSRHLTEAPFLPHA